ncbi:hypothetical protein ND747_19055, partial [Frankia sp. R82]
MRRARGWFPHRTRADRFAALLDGDAPPAGPSEVRLVALADAARALPHPQVDPVRRAAIRAQLLAELAAVAEASAPAGTPDSARAAAAARAPGA